MTCVGGAHLMDDVLDGGPRRRLQRVQGRAPLHDRGHPCAPRQIQPSSQAKRPGRIPRRSRRRGLQPLGMMTARRLHAHSALDRADRNLSTQMRLATRSTRSPTTRARDGRATECDDGEIFQARPTWDGNLCPLHSHTHTHTRNQAHSDIQEAPDHIYGVSLDANYPERQWREFRVREHAL